MTQTRESNVAALETIRVMKQKRDRNKLITNIFIYALLTAIALVFIYPFLWTVSTSFETTGGVFEFPPNLIPKSPSFRNYVDVFALVPVGRQILNSALICFIGVSGSVLIATLGAYPLAKMNFPGRDLIFYIILATLVLPNEAGMIVNYVTSAKLGWLKSDVGKYVAVIAPALANVAGLFLMRQAYLSVPLELLEAARMDGASELTIWRKVMLPLTLPTLSAFAILQFVAFWNTFLWPSIVLQGDRNLLPLSAGMLDLSSQFSTNTRATSAGAVIMILPILIVFLFFQRYFMRGLEGAVKG